MRYTEHIIDSLLLNLKWLYRPYSKLLLALPDVSLSYTWQVVCVNEETTTIHLALGSLQHCVGNQRQKIKWS